MKSSHAVAASDSSFLNEDYVAVPLPEQRRVECRLRQRQQWQDSEIELQLFNGHYLSAQDWRKPDQVERVVNLAYLNPVPRFRPGNLTPRLKMSVGSGLLLVMLMAFLHPQGLILIMLAWFCLTALVVMSAHPGRWRFYTAVGDVAVIEVMQAPFNLAQAQAFVSLISERAEGAQVVLPKGSKRLSAELAEHRRMLECGFLSRRGYECARGRLLARLRVGQSKMQLA